MTVETRPVAPAVPKVKTTADVLRHAALIIEERGWCQNVVANRKGAVCAWGGIQAATYGAGYADDPDLINIEDAATRCLARFVDPRSSVTIGSIASWNDREGRTAAEVTAALRAAADEAER